MRTQRKPARSWMRPLPAVLGLALLLTFPAWGQQAGPTAPRADTLHPAADTVPVTPASPRAAPREPPPAGPTAGPEPAADRPFRPSEEISADQTVDFPYDI